VGPGAGHPGNHPSQVRLPSEGSPHDTHLDKPGLRRAANLPSTSVGVTAKRNVRSGQVQSGYLGRKNRDPDNGQYSAIGCRCVGHSFRAVARGDSLGDMTLNSLRHRIATRCLECGVATRTVRRWLGHASVRMTGCYAHPGSAYEWGMIKALDLDPPTG
jgi:Phage integrase family